MKYRNTKTGAVIDVSSKISGPNWKPVEEQEKTVAAPVKKKRASKK